MFHVYKEGNGKARGFTQGRVGGAHIVSVTVCRLQPSAHKEVTFVLNSCCLSSGTWVCYL